MDLKPCAASLFNSKKSPPQSAHVPTLRFLCSPSIEQFSTDKMADQTASDSKDPASFLSSIIGVPVTVKLNSGVVYKGELQSVDGYMNIALENCQEFVNGKLRRTYGDAFVRGNNGMSRCAYAPPVLTGTVLYISSE